MPETRGQPEDETVADRVMPVVRSVLAGHEQGAIRRIILYVVAVTGVIAAVGVGGGLGLLLAIVAVIATLLLALTDQLL